MTSALSGNLVTFLTDGSDRMAYLPSRDEVTFGTDITCDIRFTQENVRGKHFVIYPDPATGKVNFGRIMMIIFLRDFFFFRASNFNCFRLSFSVADKTQKLFD